MTDETTREPIPEEREKFAAEAEKARAEARKAAAEAAMAEIELAESQRAEAALLATDSYHHLFRFTKVVGADSVAVCINTLSRWSRIDDTERADGDEPCVMQIDFTSPGGSVIDGLALFDFLQELRRKGHRITTRGIGYAASMAGILLQAGDLRVMAPESWLLIHEASFGAGGKIGEVEDTVEWVKRIQKRILRIFAERSNLSVGQISNRWRRKDWWISSEEALRFGLVDEVW